MARLLWNLVGYAGFGKQKWTTMVDSWIRWIKMGKLPQTTHFIHCKTCRLDWWHWEGSTLKWMTAWEELSTIVILLPTNFKIKPSQFMTNYDASCKDGKNNVSFTLFLSLNKTAKLMLLAVKTSLCTIYWRFLGIDYLFKRLAFFTVMSHFWG